jgi:PmbA protein
MKELLREALKVADDAQIYQRIISSTSIALKNGDLKSIDSEKKTEISLVLQKDGWMGNAVSTSLEDKTLIERALLSLQNQKSEAVPFANRPYDAIACYDENLVTMSLDELVHEVLSVSNRMKRLAPHVLCSVHLEREVKSVVMINSAGFEGSYEVTRAKMGLVTTSSKGFVSAGKEYGGAQLPKVRDQDLADLLKRHELDDVPVTLGNEHMPVIFSGSAMGSLMLRVLGGVHGGNVTKGVSPIRGRLNELVFSPLLTIIDDATLGDGLHSYAFDDEGTPGQRTVLYQKGVLKNYMTTISQAAKLDVHPTGNAIKRALFSKEIEDAPSTYESNLIVEGQSIPDIELFKGVKRGLYITGVMGAHTGNIVAGEFSLNIASGFLIENGELVGKVKGSMVAGNIYELFKNVGAIGTEKEIMRGIFYNLGYSPMVLFNDVSIIGS